MNNHKEVNWSHECTAYNVYQITIWRETNRVFHSCSTADSHRHTYIYTDHKSIRWLCENWTLQFVTVNLNLKKKTANKYSNKKNETKKKRLKSNRLPGHNRAFFFLCTKKIPKFRNLSVWMFGVKVCFIFVLSDTEELDVGKNIVSRHLYAHNTFQNYC